MNRRNFFSFIAGLFAGSLFPWPRRRREMPVVWAVTGYDPIVKSAGVFSEEDLREFYRRKFVAEGYKDDLYDCFSNCSGKVYTGVSPHVIHVKES